MLATLLRSLHHDALPARGAVPAARKLTHLARWVPSQGIVLYRILVHVGKNKIADVTK